MLGVTFDKGSALKSTPFYPLVCCIVVGLKKNIPNDSPCTNRKSNFVLTDTNEKLKDEKIRQTVFNVLRRSCISMNG